MRDKFTMYHTVTIVHYSIMYTQISGARVARERTARATQAAETNDALVAVANARRVRTLVTAGTPGTLPHTKSCTPDTQPSHHSETACRPAA
ncbi:Uncharacterised protein [Chlamydia trachomatis]|nr:Uncharacterised protein [Chlamydia trachomatis]